MKRQSRTTAQSHSAAAMRTKHAAHRKRVHAWKHQVRASQPLHVRALLHPIGIFMLLLVGVLITGSTLRTAADSYNLTAKVPADALIEGAIITNPSDGNTLIASPIIVSGNCPDGSYVNLTRNGIFSGVAWCASNSFSIQTSLTAGNNTLQAQDYNITDDAGPATPPLTIIYTPSTPVTPPSQTGTSPTANQPAASELPALTLTSEYHFQLFATDKTFTWPLQINGGKAPYNIRSSWGDGSASSDTALAAGPHTLSHQYHQAGYFPIIVKVSDVLGAETTLQLAALIKVPGAISFNTTTSTPAGSGLAGFIQNLLALLVDSKLMLWLAWPAYAVTVLMVASFWLGERQILRRRLAAQAVRVAKNRKHN